MKVILEGQGDKKTIPILSSGKPVFSTARRRARIAAASMGEAVAANAGSIRKTDTGSVVQWLDMRY